jgi:YD repeat-containing protein
MKFFHATLKVASALIVCGATIGLGQSPEQSRSDSVRVTVSMHPDGSRTVYKFDNAEHKAVATTTDPDGKLRETIRYELDEAGRFSSGEISGPDGRLRFKSRYKYDDAGRLLEETQSTGDGTLLHKIVYSYDASGKQTGYSVFDASGKLVGGKSAGKVRATSSPKPREKGSR